MKTINHFFRSFQTRVTLLLLGAMLFSGIFSNLLIYRLALRSQFEQLREQLKMLAATAVLGLDVSQFQAVPLSTAGRDTAAFKSVAATLKKIKDVNPRIRYIYTLTRTQKPGIWQFVVDPSDPTSEEKRKHLVSYPGTPYNASRFPEMMKAYEGPQADRNLSVDEWGVTLSGYAPIRDARGRAVAVLGVDIGANDVYRIQRQVHMRALLVLLVGIALSLILGMLISRRISEPIKKLVAGTRYVARQEFYKVELGGTDEIRELSSAFNDMSMRLYRSRRRLRSYFYRIVQALVRILEARDRYTQGHSERVAEYACMIGKQLNFSAENLELLRESAVLHDIGKLGIEERILNKEEPLTDAEWAAIRRHPLIAEDILAPILLNKELLAIIRGHHERYDGSGYPDGLKGAGIRLFAQILSVADSYDAMTSLRSYRPALKHEKAMEEMVKQKNSQFSPDIVNAFIAVMKAHPRKP